MPDTMCGNQPYPLNKYEGDIFANNIFRTTSGMKPLEGYEVSNESVNQPCCSIRISLINVLVRELLVTIWVVVGENYFI